MTILRDIAHARAGDKGDSSILLLRPWSPADFPRVTAAVTPTRVAAHFGVDPASVSVTGVPALGTLTVLVRGVLAGGVTRSPRIDPHGKTLSGHLLDLDVP